MRTLKFVLVFLLVSFAGRAVASGMPVEVVGKASDTVGGELLYAVKERIRSSRSLALTFDQREPRLQVLIVTLDPTNRKTGQMTVYSVVITWKNPSQPYPLFLNSLVGSTGGTYVDRAAEAIVASVANESDGILRMLQSVPSH